MTNLRSDLGDRIDMVNKEKDKADGYRKKSLWNKLTNWGLIGVAAAGIGLSDGNFSNSKAATVAHAHQGLSYSDQGLIGPPGLFAKELPSEFRDAYVSRSDKRTATKILFKSIDSDLKKHPAWAFVWAHVSDNIARQVPKIYGNVDKLGKEVGFFHGIDNWVGRYQQKNKSIKPIWIEESLVISLAAQAGYKINDAKDFLEEYSSYSKGEKVKMFSKINPKGMNEHEMDYLNWTVSALLTHYEFEKNTSNENYKIIKSLESKWKLPRVL